MKALIFNILLISFSNLCFAQGSDSDDEFDKVRLKYGAKTIGTTGDFKVFVVGSSVSEELLKDKKVVSELSQIHQLADVVIVGSDRLKETLANLTGLDVYVAERYFDEIVTEISSSKYWVLICKKDGELSHFISSRDIGRMLSSTKIATDGLKAKSDSDSQIAE